MTRSKSIMEKFRQGAFFKGFGSLGGHRLTVQTLIV
jgi:hypothetical protein